MAMLVAMNWQKIIDDLVSLGMTQADIAKKIGVSQPTVSNIKSGNIRDLLHSNGCALVRLHKRTLRASKITSPGASAL